MGTIHPGLGNTRSWLQAVVGRDDLIPLGIHPGESFPVGWHGGEEMGETGLERSVKGALRTVPGKLWFGFQISRLLFLVNPSLAQTPFFPTHLLPPSALNSLPESLHWGPSPAEEGQGPRSRQS